MQSGKRRFGVNTTNHKKVDLFAGGMALEHEVIEVAAFDVQALPPSSATAN